MIVAQTRPLSQLIKWARPVFNSKAIRNLVESGLSPTKVKETIEGLTGNENLAQRGRWLAVIYRDYRDYYNAEITKIPVVNDTESFNTVR